MSTQSQANSTEAQLRKPSKNCKRCWGRGVVTLVLARDQVTNNEVKKQKPCFCTYPKPKQERKQSHV